MEKSVIVSVGKIDAATLSVPAQRLEHSAWGFRLPVSQSTAAEDLLCSIDEKVKEHVNTVIITSAQGDSHVKNQLFTLEKVEHKRRARPSDAAISTGANIPLLVTKHVPTANDIFQVDAACTSSLKALDLACTIASNSNQVVLITALDFSTASYMLFIFNSLGALATGEQYYSPFDVNRSGFAMGEGAAVVAVCSASYAKENKLPVIATIDSVGSYTKSVHPTDPTSSIDLTNFVKHTIDKSNRKLIEFAYWDAHATATPAGDTREFEVFDQIFKDIPISSFKGHIGHCLSASSLLEIVNAIEHLQQNIIPATYKITTPMNDDSRIITTTQSSTHKTFVKCSFGFAGRNASTVITVE